MRRILEVGAVLMLAICQAPPCSCRPGDALPQHTEPAESATQTEARQLFAQALELLKTNHAFEARALLERAARLEPDSAAVHCNLGLAYQNSGNLTRAQEEFQTALKLSPNMPAATLNMAGCFQSMGETQQAIEWFEKFLTLHPSAADAAQVKDVIAAIKAASEKPGSNAQAPDYFPSVTAEGTYRWPAEKLPIKVFVSPGDGVLGFRPGFRQALLASLDAWIEASGHRLSYILTPNRADAYVVCEWTNNPAEVSQAGTESERGITDVVANSSNEIQRATIKILTKPMLEEGVLSDDELKKACLHEIGHVLGLQGHSTNNHDVMFFTIDTATVWPVLTKRDKATIARLYESYTILPPAPNTMPASQGVR
jgi:tetratricopeptide (TPR) repeat protein